MEAQRKVQLIVGGFLVGGLLIVMFTVFLLGADKALFTSYARLHAHFESVQGLAEGSVVSLSGVTVGNIEKILFNDQNQQLDVVIKVDERFLIRIPRDSQVEIRTQGALGDKFIYIIPGNPAEGSLKDGDTLGVAKATDLLGIVSERGQEAAKIFDIINDLHRVTQALTKDQKLERMMVNLTKASEDLNTTAQQAKKLTAGLAEGDLDKKMNRTMDRFESIVTRIDKGQGTLGALINDPSLHNRLKALLGGGDRKSHVKDLLRTSIEKAEDGK